MSPSRCTLAVLVGLFLGAPVSAIAADPAEQRFVGYLGDGSGSAYHRAGQGGLHQLILTDGVRRARTVRYRV